MTRDAHQSILRNALYLVNANVFGAVAGILTFGLMTRALGPTDYGILLLIQAVAMLFNRFFNLQSWQAVISLGSRNMGDPGHIRTIFRQAILLDSLTCAFASVTYLVFVSAGTRILPYPDGYVLYAIAAVILIMSDVTGSSIGVLRLDGRFRWLMYLESSFWATRLLLSVLAYLFAPTFASFFWIMVGTTGFKNAACVVLGARCLRRPAIVGMAQNGHPDSRKTSFVELLRFTVTTNISSTLRLAANELGVVVIGYLLSPGEVAYYDVLRKIGSLLDRVRQPLADAFYPHVAPLVKTRDFGSLYRSVVTTGRVLLPVGAAFLLAVWFFAKPIILTISGVEYIGAAPYLRLYCVGIGLSLMSFPTMPVILAFEKPGLLMWLNGLSTSLYLVALYGLTSSHQLEGAVLAFIIYVVVFVTAGYLIVARLLARARPA
jgi:O-antigen/teichoic acid export membrane protein